MIYMIFASSSNNIIGKDNKLPWHLPDDLSRFKRLTGGHTVVMGRKTYESLPFFPKGFPNRNNVIVSKTLEAVEGCTVVNNLEDYLKTVPETEKVWVVGGSEIYKQCLPYIDAIYHTEVLIEAEGDTSFELMPYDLDLFDFRYSVGYQSHSEDIPSHILRYYTKAY